MGYLGYYRLLYYGNYSIGFVPLGGEDQENSELFPWQHVARVQVLHFFLFAPGAGTDRPTVPNDRLPILFTVSQPFHTIRLKTVVAHQWNAKGKEWKQPCISKLWKQLPY